MASCIKKTSQVGILSSDFLFVFGDIDSYLDFRLGLSILSFTFLQESDSKEFQLFKGCPY